MTEQEIANKVRNVLSTVLKCHIDSDKDFDRNQNGSWDSLKQVEIIFNLEEVFNVQFSEEQMVSLDSLNKIVAVVKSYYET